MREVIVRIRDDLDAQRGVSDAALADKTVVFGWDGVQYELDLTAAHADEMAEVLAPYLAVARKVQPTKKGKRRAVTETVTAQQLAEQITPWDKAERARVRKWAIANGYDQSPIGQIKQEVRDAYYAAGADRE